MMQAQAAADCSLSLAENVTHSPDWCLERQVSGRFFTLACLTAFCFQFHDASAGQQRELLAQQCQSLLCVCMCVGGFL